MRPNCHEWPGVYCDTCDPDNRCQARPIEEMSNKELLDEASERGAVRQFASGATRDTDEGKLDYEGFLSPQTVERFARYMNVHRTQSDGNLRSSDNWQKGIPKEQYVKSMFRHFMDVWALHRGRADVAENCDIEEALCALMFNVQGYLFEVLNGR